MKVVVLGGGGTIGRSLVPTLAIEHEVIAVSRRPHDPDPNAEWRVADVTDLASLVQALADPDVVYPLVHSLGRGDFAERDRVGAGNVARAAAEAGARQIVYLGGLGDDATAPSKHPR